MHGYMLRLIRRKREFYMTEAPEYVVNFVLDAKKGIYPSFKEIR